MPISINEIEELIVPCFELACNPMTKFNEEGNHPGAHKRALLRAEESIRRLEDVETFKAINAAIEEDHSFNIHTKITTSALRTGMSLIEEHDLICEAITMHVSQFVALDEARHPKLVTVCAKDARRTGVWGYFHKTPIYVSTMCPKNAVYLTAARDIVGCIVVRKALEIIDADDSQKLRMGHILIEEVGFGVVADYGCARILCEQFQEPPAPPSTPQRSEIIKQWEDEEHRERSRHVGDQANSAPIQGEIEKLALSPMELEKVREIIHNIKGQRVARGGTPEDAELAAKLRKSR